MNSSRRFTLALLLGDLLSVFLAFNAVAILRGVVTPSAPLLWPLLVPAVLLVLCFSLIEGYAARTDYLSLEYTSEHLFAVAGALLGTLLITYVLISSAFTLQQSRLVAALAFVVMAPLGLGVRRVMALRRAAVQRSRTLIFVGDQNHARDFIAECARVGFDHPITYAAASEAEVSPEHPALATLLDLVEAGHLSTEAIVLRESARELPEGLPQRLVQLHFSRIPTYTLELFHEAVWRKIPLYRINQTWLFQGGFTLAREPIFDHLKRSSDLLLSVLVLPLFAPLVFLAALAIRLDDGGPVFFSQARIGRHRKVFQLYKLRTMRLASEKGPLYTEKNDKRITRVGGFLRASRLDELPQIWNVLRGEMSVIGPRAEWDRLVANYEKQIPCYHFRHLVRPGITGWAQVNYPYGANLDDTLRKLEYDLYYIRHYNLRLDAAIVLKTIHVMLFGKGSR